MEAWLPAGKEARELAFLLNLNALATISERCSCPLVLWRRNTFFLLFSTTLRISTPFTLALRLSPTPETRQLVTLALTSQGIIAESGLLMKKN